MPQYTIAVAALNESLTIRESIESMLGCTGDETEVLVVDGGSTDGTVDVLRELGGEHERIRVISTAKRESDLAEDRNVGVREARGDHVLLQLDADDDYRTIRPYIELYERLLSDLEEPFFLSASGINIAPKALLLRYGPYRPGLPRAEDVDLWRRLAVNGDLLWLDNEAPMEELGPKRGTRDHFQDRVDELIGHLRAGVPLYGILWHVIAGEAPKKDRLLTLSALPVAMLRFPNGPQYELPEGWNYATPQFPESEKRSRLVETCPETFEP